MKEDVQRFHELHKNDVVNQRFKCYFHCFDPKRAKAKDLQILDPQFDGQSLQTIAKSCKGGRGSLKGNYPWDWNDKKHLNKNKL